MNAPVLKNRVCLVTGATTGIGRAIAFELARHDPLLIVHGRDPVKTAALVAELQSETTADVRGVNADFSSLSAVSELAQKVIDEHGVLHVLINNAGVLTDERRTTDDGFEWTFAVNHLAPLLLTLKLLDTLRASAPARIAFNSSSAMGSAALDLTDLHMERRFDGWTAYANTKLANMLMSNLLAEQLATSGVVSNAFCPGLVDSNLLTGNRDFGEQRIERMRLMMRPAEQGAVTPVFLATAPEAATINGAFFLKSHGNGTAPLSIGWDRSMAERLWQVSLEYLAPFLH